MANIVDGAEDDTTEGDPSEVASTALSQHQFLSDLLSRGCSLSSIRPFQLQHGLDLVLGDDIFLVIAPGCGKTLVSPAPLLYVQVLKQSGVAIIVEPSKFPSTVHLAISGTACPNGDIIISSKLGFAQDHFVYAQYSVDRTNIKYVVRFLAHASSANDFLDLSFLIPFDMSSAEDITTTLIFCKTIDLGYRVMAYLDSLIPTSIPIAHASSYRVACCGMLLTVNASNGG